MNIDIRSTIWAELTNPAIIAHIHCQHYVGQDFHQHLLVQKLQFILIINDYHNQASNYLCVQTLEVNRKISENAGLQDLKQNLFNF